MAKSPLLGDLGYPGPPSLTSLGPGPVPEERGRVWDTGGKNKTSKVLERWPLASKASPRGLENSRSMKRLQRTHIGKESKARKTQLEGRKQGVLEK